MVAVEPLTPDVVAEIEAACPEAADLLGAGLEDEPGSIVAAIDGYVREHRDGGIERSAILNLGVLLGMQYVRAFGWEWVELVYDDGPAAFAVVDPGRGIGNQPMNWIYDVVENGQERNFLLNFNMVGAGNVPSPTGDGPIMFN